MVIMSRTKNEAFDIYHDRNSLALYIYIYIYIYKARLVARGFKEIEKDSIREDSPTWCKRNFRIILSIIEPGTSK